MSRWMALLPLIALVALGGLFYFYALKRDPQVQPQAMVGKPMPDLALPTLRGGQPVRLRAMAAEHPMLMGLKGRGVRVVGVAYKDAPPNTEAFLTRLGDPFVNVVVDRDGAAGVEFGVTGVPETYAVGREGQIVAKHTGPLSETDAARLVNLLR